MGGTRCMGDKVAGQGETVVGWKVGERCRRAGTPGEVSHRSDVLVRRMVGREARRMAGAQACYKGDTVPVGGHRVAGMARVRVVARLVVGRRGEGVSHRRDTAAGAVES